MKKYIDVEALLNNLPDDLPYKASVKRVLMQAPSTDVVEVVRCKDCKHGTLFYGEIKCTVDEDGDDCGLIMYHDPQHYCRYGERIEDK